MALPRMWWGDMLSQWAMFRLWPRYATPKQAIPLGRIMTKTWRDRLDNPPPGLPATRNGAAAYFTHRDRAGHASTAYPKSGHGARESNIPMFLRWQQDSVLCGPDKQSSALHSSSAVNVIISRRSLCNNTLVESANTTTGSKYSRR